MSIPTFPILQPLDKAQSCRGKDTCSNCRLFKAGRCPGCSAVGGRDRCSQCDCLTNCNTCGGFKVEVPAICTKSPLRDVMLDKVWDIDLGKIPQGRTADLPPQSRAILVMNGGKRPMFRPSIDSKRYDNVQAVAVSLWRVWSSRGWYADDLKDYLGIPKRVKLIITTLVYDDALERAADHELHYEMMERKDVDLVHPLTYSIYTDHSVINQFFAWRRTLKVLEEAGGDFLQLDVTSFSITDEVKTIAAKVPQIMWHLSMSDNLKDPFFVSLARRIMFFHKLLPKKVSFWFMGPSSPTIVHACKVLAPGRPLYFLTSAPWMAAHKGHEYSTAGKMVKSPLPQDELTIRAFENYAKMVQSA